MANSERDTSRRVSVNKEMMGKRHVDPVFLCLFVPTSVRVLKIGFEGFPCCEIKQKYQKTEKMTIKKKLVDSDF